MPKLCHACGAKYEEKETPGFRADCLQCGSPLHCCANCRFYRKNAHEWCNEPQARPEKPRETEAANTCAYFLFGGDANRADTRADEAKRKLAELFGDAAPESKPDKPDWA